MEEYRLPLLHHPEMLKNNNPSTEDIQGSMLILGLKFLLLLLLLFCFVLFF